MDAPAATHGPVPSQITTQDGLRLTIATRGPAAAPPLLFAHGFGQSRRAWTRTAETLAARGWRTVTFDARGHGDSDRLPGGEYRLEQFADDLLAVTRSLDAPPVLIGASMGGLLGLVLAGEIRPVPFRALVLVDITPRWEASGVARMLGFMRAHPRGFGSLEDAAAAVAAYLPQRRRSKRRDELAQLLRRGDDGRLRWHWDPALLETVAHEAERSQPRVLAAAHRVEVPALLVAGGRSDVVSEATVAEFQRAVPHARLITVVDAGHTLAGDDNAAFTAAIEPFLDTLDQSAVPGPAASLRGLS